MTMRSLFALLFAGALVLPLPARALPENLQALRGELAGERPWHRWGSGEMRWFGLTLYRATLWVAGQADGALREDAPLALRLEYQRDIPGARIVAASVDEMQRLGVDAARLQRWEGEMRRLFPDVRKGDAITGVFLPGRGARFFLGGQALGEVNDADFARSFFAIWLDPRTRAPDLRAALLSPQEG